MDLASSVKQWVALDNQLRRLNEARRDLLAQRSEQASEIQRHADRVPNGVIKITDGRLKLANTSTRAPLTLQHVESCLQTCIPNPADVETIMALIRERRPMRTAFDIKRMS